MSKDIKYRSMVTKKEIRKMLDDDSIFEFMLFLRKKHQMYGFWLGVLVTVIFGLLGVMLSG